MKISQMTPEQIEAKRTYDREAKKRSRAKARQENEKLATPNAHDYVIPEPQQKRLTERSHGLQKTIAAELAWEKLPVPDEYIVDAVGCVLLGLETNVAQIVHLPDGMGMLVGGWFPDAAASETIEHV